MHSDPLFVVAGRTIRRAATITPRRDNYTLRATLDAGLVGAQSADLAEVERVVTRAMASDALARAFSGVLVEDGVAWTPAWADAMADTILDSEDPAVRAAYQARAVDVVLDFFVSGGRSWGISPSASIVSPPSGPASDALPAPSLPNAPSDSAASLDTTSATGTPPSASSPSTTPTATG